MDVYFNSVEGSFFLDPDDEDIAKSTRERFLVLNRAVGEKWQVLPGYVVKDGARFDEFAFTDHLSIDDGESHVTYSSSSVFGYAASERMAYAIMKAVSASLLALAKSEESEEQAMYDEVEEDVQLDSGESQ